MKVYTDGELAVLALDSLKGLEYKYEMAALKAVPSPEFLFSGGEALKTRLAPAIGEQKAKTVAMSLTKQYCASVVSGLEKRGITAVTLFSEEYPERLKVIDAPPLVLYCKGNTALLSSSKTFGTAGSRKTLPYAEQLLKNIAKTCAAAGITVVTGNAPGADRAALTSSYESGKVISVIIGGFDHIYPECNSSLVNAVAKTGLVVSEQPPDVAPMYWMFPVRNRIIAGLSDAVLVVSGDKKSGARHTAEFALNYGKSVFAFPYSVGIKSGELCNELIKNGAGLCDSCDDILDELDVKFDPAEEEALSLEGDEKKLYEAIKGGAEDMTKYCNENGVKFFEIAPALSSLEIMGLIVKTAGNRYKPVK